MKQLLWSAIAVLVLVFPAHADDAKVVGKWRAEYALSSKDKPQVAWLLELEKGGTFRMTELAPNAPEKFRKEMEKEGANNYVPWPGKNICLAQCFSAVGNISGCHRFST